LITVYFDTETGGVELGTFEQKISFNEADADPTALALNHYTRQEWVNSCAPQIAASRFAAWIRPHCTLERISKAGNPYRVAVLSAYNAPFDTPRLDAMFGTSFCPWDRRVRDVLQRVLWWFDLNKLGTPPENFKLSTVASYMDISADGAHDALADARLAAKVSHWLNCEAQVGF